MGTIFKYAFINGFFLFLLLGNSEEVFAQKMSIELTRPQVTPVSPEAAAVEKYVSYPVSYCTGIPEISIPLYEIKVGDLVLPISLSYHSAGLKPKERSGWVGTGWTLNAEPSVMRTVCGIADNNRLKNGYFYNNYQAIRDASSALELKKYFRQIVNKDRYDEEPDRFYYKLSSKSGTFWGNQTSRNFPIKHPYDDNVTVHMLPQDLSYIDISDENGQLYKFGGSDDFLERTGDDITRWLCKEINSSVTKAKITFSYEYTPINIDTNLFNMTGCVTIEDSILGSLGGLPKFIKNDGYLTTEYVIQSNGNKVLLPFGGTSFNLPPSHTSNILKERKVTGIYFSCGSVEFERNGSDLSCIKIKDQNQQVIRRISFFVSPYNAQTELTKLDSLIISVPGCENHVYYFKYYGGDLVPPMLTKAIDHWGFANGRHSDIRPDEHVISGYAKVIETNYGGNLNIQLGSFDRESHSEWAVNGILSEIKNPTGSVTTFCYEGNLTGVHPYGFNEDEACFPISVGGLRIRRIDERESCNQKSSTYIRLFKYNYEDKEHNDSRYNWGVVKHLITANDYCFEQTKSYDRSNGFVFSRLRTWSAMPVSNITFHNGSSVLYNKVTEFKKKLGSPDEQATVYYYNTPKLDFDGADWNEGPSGSVTGDIKLHNIRRQIDIPYDVEDYNDFQYGKLIKVENFDNDILVSKTDYEYNLRFLDSSLDCGIRISRPYRSQIFISDEYVHEEETEEKFIDKSWIFTGAWMELSKQIDTIYYLGNRKVGTVKDYSYVQSDLGIRKPIKIETTTSTNKKIEDYYTYPGYDVANYPEELGGSLFNENIRDVVLEHKKVVGNDTTYARRKYKANKPYIIKAKMQNGGSFENYITYNKYDNYGNIADVSGNDNMHTCYLWSYNNQYPIAKIENTTYDNLLAALGKDEAWVTNLGNKNIPAQSDWQLINELRDILSNSLIYTFTYKSLIGVSSITSPNKISTYFDYDNYGRLIESYIIESGARKVVSANQYNYREKFAGIGVMGPDDLETPSYSSIELNLNINNPNGVSNVKQTFVADIEGGSGNFEYTWKLSYYGGDTFETKVTHANSVEMTPRYKKDVWFQMNNLSCYVVDLDTGEEARASTGFTVVLSY